MGMALGAAAAGVVIRTGADVLVTPQAFATGEPAPVAPLHGAGEFDVDPSQAGVSQSPTAAVTGIAVMPEMDL